MFQNQKAVLKQWIILTINVNIEVQIFPFIEGRNFSITEAVLKRIDGFSSHPTAQNICLVAALADDGSVTPVLGSYEKTPPSFKLLKCSLFKSAIWISPELVPQVDGRTIVMSTRLNIDGFLISELKIGPE